MDPRVWITSVTFSDSTTIELEPGDVVVFVGPNNSGKSASLRAIRDRIASADATSPVLRALQLDRHGSDEELHNWLAAHARLSRDNPSAQHYRAHGFNLGNANATNCWARNGDLGQLAKLFCNFLTADARLAAANPADAIDLRREPLENPIHILQRFDAFESQVSREFRRAFGIGLVVHRNAGRVVPIYTADPPTLEPPLDRASYEYIEALEKEPQLHEQGDGMRSFAGVLLHTVVGKECILLIDEPEAFLHPPQARLMGRMLVEQKPDQRQLFVATHSGDVLRGILDANCPKVHVVRIQRDQAVNRVRELNGQRMSELWADPLLRYSNVLDGLFHQKVCVCESDSDCRFFAAVLDSLVDQVSDDAKRPDIMFTHCGGKARVPLVIRSLRELDVPVNAIVDFDVLNNEQPLRGIFEAAGGNWEAIQKDWKLVKNSVDGKKPELSIDEVKREVRNALDNAQEQNFLIECKKRIQEILRKSSPWAIAKTVGIAFIPNGEPSQARLRLFAELEAHGVFVVPEGEAEGFVRSASGHGPAWVNDVLASGDLQNNAELDVARSFITKVFPDI